MKLRVKKSSSGCVTKMDWVRFYSVQIKGFFFWREIRRFDTAELAVDYLEKLTPEKYDEIIFVF